MQFQQCLNQRVRTNSNALVHSLYQDATSPGGGDYSRHFRQLISFYGWWELMFRSMGWKLSAFGVILVFIFKCSTPKAALECFILLISALISWMICITQYIVHANIYCIRPISTVRTFFRIVFFGNINSRYFIILANRMENNVVLYIDGQRTPRIQIKPPCWFNTRNNSCTFVYRTSL